MTFMGALADGATGLRRTYHNACQCALILVISPAAMTMAAPINAQESDDAVALDAEVVRLDEERKYVEAIPLAERALAIREQVLGPAHPDHGAL